MASGYDWVKLAFDVIFRVVGLALGALQLVVFYRIWRWWTFERPVISRGRTTDPRFLFKRLFCRHRHVYRSRDHYGKHSTFCLGCDVDVNAGKPQEQWR